MPENLKVDFEEIEDLFEDESPQAPTGLDTDLEVDDDDTSTEDTKNDDIKETEEINLDTKDVETKEEVKEEETSDEDIPLTKELATMFGFEFEEEFEDSVEGILNLTKTAATKLAEQELDEIFNEHPQVKSLLEYLNLGGDPNKFMDTTFPETDYTTIELTDDERQHEMLVTQELLLKGYTQEDIQAELEDYKAGGILENKAKRALVTLKKHQVAEKEAIVENQRKEFENQQREIEKYWNGVNDTITKSTQFKGLTIPEADKKGLFDYISKPVKDGKSQRDLDVEASDMETRLAVDYLLMKKFNLSNLVVNKAKSLQAKSLRDRLQRSKVGSAPTPKRTGEVELEAL